MSFSLEEIKIKINEIKKNSIRPLTNFYDNIPKNRNIVSVYNKEKSIVFCVDDNSVYRGYFYSSDLDELQDLLGKLNKNTIVDIITKKENLDVSILLNKSGFEKYAIFKRASNPNICEFDEINNAEYLENKLDNLGKYAELRDLKLIHSKLYKIFNPYTSHIMTVDELEYMIINKQVMVNITNNDLVSFLIFRIEGCKFYINHVYNNGDRKIIDYIMKKSLTKYINDFKINYLYSWIDEKNVRSIRFHERYGMKFDGLIDFIYIKS